MTLWKLGRETAALAALREGVEQHRATFARAPQVAAYRYYLSGADAVLAKIALEMGYAGEAVAAALERQKLWPGDPVQLYAAAAELARAAEVRVEDGEADGEKTAALALAALREAVAAGFRDGPRLRKDPAFAGLRGRPDFEDILTGLTAGKGP
jgi:hypothetical protein